jgi:hypothetical protein
MNRLALAGAALAAFAAIPAFAQPAPAPEGAPPPLRRADVAQQLRDQFTRLDANHDNILTREEAAADTGQRGAGGPGRGPGGGDFFDRLDTNHDNMLSRDEFAALRTMFRGGGGGGGGMMGLGGNWFDRVDANQDGKVTLDEMTKTVLGLFDRTDANHDGIITPEEREAAMRARMQQQPPAGGQ